MNDMPKVALVQSIYSVADAAIEQSCSKQTWVIRFGEPSTTQEYADNMIILDYYDPRPYQPPVASVPDGK